MEIQQNLNNSLQETLICSRENHVLPHPLGRYYVTSRRRLLCEYLQVKKKKMNFVCSLQWLSSTRYICVASTFFLFCAFFLPWISKLKRNRPSFPSWLVFFFWLLLLFCNKYLRFTVPLKDLQYRHVQAFEHLWSLSTSNRIFNSSEKDLVARTTSSLFVDQLPRLATL